MDKRGLNQQPTFLTSSRRTDPSIQDDELFRSLVDRNPDGIVVHINGIITFANPAALRLSGTRNARSIIGHSIFEFLAKGSHTIFRHRIKQMLATGKPALPLEATILRANGSPVEVEILSAPIPWHEHVAIQVVVRDISIRKRFERKLRDSEARFHQLADSMPQIVWSATPDGRVDYCNQKFFEQTGLREDALDPCNVWAKILHPDDARPTTRAWKSAVRTGAIFEAEYRYRTREPGKYEWHLGRALPIHDQSGKIVRWFGTCTNIHEKKQNELALQATKQQLGRITEHLEEQVASRTKTLQASIQAMEEFCYSIAHNLRAPLRAMQGFATAMLEDHAQVLDETGKDYARRIDSAAANMDRLIDDLLAYGRLAHEDLPNISVSLETVLKNVISTLQSEVAARNGVVSLQNLNYRVFANPSALEQVFIHLISNGLKFTKNGERPRIEISGTKIENVIRISVCDNGIGIAAEHQRRIFKPFEKLHTVDDYPGTGIGLAIVSKAVERIKGKLGVESKHGAGSCFWIEIPVHSTKKTRQPRPKSLYRTTGVTV